MRTTRLPDTEVGAYCRTPYQIHDGYCGYGYLDQNVGTGWMVREPNEGTNRVHMPC